VGMRSVPSSVSVVGAALTFTRPAEGGSRRFIELRRGSNSQRIDLYCFTTGQCGELPSTLRNNDGLFIPSRGKLVAVSGAVNRPGIYELAENEGVDQLLEYAGGLAIDSSAEPVDLYSFGSDLTGRVRAYQSTTLASLCRRGQAAAGCRKLQDGDFLDLRPMITTVRGMVTVTADGVEPQRMTHQPGMRLLDVIKQPLTRFLSKETIAGINRGDFRSINELDDRLPEIDLESVTVYRLKADSRGYESVSVDALSALKEGPASAQNIAIEDGDILALDTKSAWRSPRDSMTGTVRLLGEVKRPGRYRFTGVRKLNELLEQAGGMTPSAASWSAVILRNDDPRASLNRRAGVGVLQSVFAYQARENALTFASAAAAEQQPMAIGEPATRRNQASGPIVLPRASAELERLVGQRTLIFLDSLNVSSVSLAPGDVVIIPPVQETIGCYGAVFRTGEFTISGATVTTDQARNRCGIVQEMSPTIYQFSVRTGEICRESWLSSCPDLSGGDFMVAVPDAVRKRGVAAFLEYVEAFYRVALSAATLKVLSN
jgi:protein involved in polysaccharide export with SLBB domain